METKSAWKVVVAIIAGIWGHFHPLVQLLLGFIAVDVLSGVLAAMHKQTLCRDVSFAGVSRKIMILLMVGMGELLGKLLPLISVQTLPELPIGSAAAGFYCLTEAISITENAMDMGVRIPTIIKATLAKFQAEEEARSKGNPAP